MCHFQPLADRVEIDGLRNEFTDASMMYDWDRLASLFTEDGVWSMPHGNVRIVGRDNIRTEIERLRGMWGFFVQNTHSGAIELSGDTATGRAYIVEFGTFRDNPMLNYSLYHDRYRRTADGWKFAEREYEIRYLDTTPLTGSVPDPNLVMSTE